MSLSRMVGLGSVLAASLTLIAANSMDEIRSGNFAAHTPQQNGSLRLFDWNIDRGHNPDRIAAAISSQNPTIAILQEVDLNAKRTNRVDLAAELAQKLHMNYVFAPEFQELSQGNDEDPAYHGQATLTALPVLTARILRFERQSGFWKPRPFLPAWPMFQRRVGGRIALVTELQFDSRRLIIYNLHLESRSAGEIQAAQLEEVLRDAAQYPENTPVIIAGDLNTKYRSATRTITARLKTAGYRNVLGDRKARTHVIVGDLDWIFIRGPVRCENARVHRNVSGSDHYPLTAELTPGNMVGRTTTAKMPLRR